MHSVSILIPTLNAANVLEGCLQSIAFQNYPADLIEIVVADGGSTDNTLEIAKKYGAKIIENKLKTGEAGKAAALKVAKNDLIAFIDSDNILPDPNWLNEMITPLEESPTSLGSEPWSYTWRREDGFITRYCALLGMNDPLVHFLGNYDRLNLLTGKWTEMPHKEIDKGTYIVTTFDKSGLPTIGANGTLFRKNYIKKYENLDYLFDIDLLKQQIDKTGSVEFIKVKNGIIHLYCGSSIAKFALKQKRRVTDFLYYRKTSKRSYNWENFNNQRLVKFCLYTALVLPVVFQSIVGYSRKPDIAWFFHPLACCITLVIYGTGLIKSQFVNKELDRAYWSQ